MGWEFTPIARFLGTFAQFAGDVHLSSLTVAQVSEFIGTPTPSAFSRYARLRRFFMHWKARGQLEKLPLPAPIPRGHSTFVPHIYSRAEIWRLVSEPVLSSTVKPRVIDPLSFRTLLLFLYATGASLTEALTLKECDVDLKRDVMTLQRASHARRRTIPIGSDVHKLLTTYLESPIRKKFNGRNFFVTRNGTPVHSATLSGQFRVIRRMQMLFDSMVVAIGRGCKISGQHSQSI